MEISIRSVSANDYETIDLMCEYCNEDGFLRLFELAIDTGERRYKELICTKCRMELKEKLMSIL